jgi:hypothetical protein
MLGVWGELEVKAPHSTGSLVEGAVDLAHLEIHPVLSKVALAERPGKPAALIADGLTGHAEGARDCQGFELHRKARG